MQGGVLSLYPGAVPRAERCSGVEPSRGGARAITGALALCFFPVPGRVIYRGRRPTSLHPSGQRGRSDGLLDPPPILWLAPRARVVDVYCPG